jgi:hypothetical protein
MSWTLSEHNYKWFCISVCGCDLFRGKSSRQGKLSTQVIRSELYFEFLF